MSEMELQTEVPTPGGASLTAAAAPGVALPAHGASLLADGGVLPADRAVLTGSSAASPAAGSILVVLTPQTPGSLPEIFATLAEAFPGRGISVAAPADTLPEELGDDSFPTLRLVEAGAGAVPGSRGNGWTLTAADFLRAFEVNRSVQAAAVLLLGPGAAGLSAGALGDLASAVIAGGAGLAVPRYDLPPRAGLVNSAILYPLSRALFGGAARFPLAVDLGLSGGFAERLATDAQRFTAAGKEGTLLWPVTQAAVAGTPILEVDGGPRPQPAPASPDLNALLAEVCGSLFADIDLRASSWQRARVAPPSKVRTAAATPATHASGGEPAVAASEIAPLIDSFQLAYGNLHEIWSLVLPPQTLLGLKRLAATPAASFHLGESLWARIVFDFLLGYRLRTLNRSHLLGALTPLYLAWVASYLRGASSPAAADALVEAQAAAFEADKPYLVSRWRWPDRFNP